MRITIMTEKDTPPDCGVEYSWHVENNSDGRGYHGKGRERDEARAVQVAIQAAHAYSTIITGGGE
jgi:hypothetical protein